MAGKGHGDEPEMRELAGPLSGRGRGGSAQDARMARRARQLGCWGAGDIQGKRKYPTKRQRRGTKRLDEHGTFEASASGCREPRAGHVRHEQTERYRRHPEEAAVTTCSSVCVRNCLPVPNQSLVKEKYAGPALERVNYFTSGASFRKPATETERHRATQGLCGPSGDS